MNCEKCGTNVPEGESFCPACGAFVAGDADITRAFLLNSDADETLVLPATNRAPVMPVVDKTEIMPAVESRPHHAAHAKHVRAVVDDDMVRETHSQAADVPDADATHVLQPITQPAVDTSGLDNSQTIDLQEKTPEPVVLPATSMPPQQEAKEPSLQASEPTQAPSQEETTSEEDCGQLENTDEGENKYKKVAIALSALAAVVVVIAIALGVYSQIKQYQLIHDPITVQVVVEATGYTDGEGTGIPLHVEGTDLDGNTISQDEVTVPGLVAFSLPRGDYTVTCLGDAIDVTGAFFEHTVDNVSFTVDQNGYHTTGEDASEAGGRPLFTYVMQTSISVTDDQLDAVRDWSNALGQPSDTVEALIAQVKLTREQSVNEQLQGSIQEIEDREQAAIEAAAQAEREAKANALAANPTEATVGATLSLTGTLQRVAKDKAETGTGWNGVWYVLVLPRAITVEGQSISEVQVAFVQGDTSTRIVSGDEEELSEEPWETAKDKTVTVTGTLTAGDGSAQYLHSYCLANSNLRATF